MLLPGAQVTPGAPARTPPRTSTGGRSSVGGGATGSSARTPPGNAWSASTPIATASNYPGPRSPSGVAPASPSQLHTPCVAPIVTPSGGASMTAETTPPYTSTPAMSQQSAVRRGAVNAASQRRPMRKSMTERPSQGVRGGIRASLPNSAGPSGNQDNTPGMVWPASARNTGRGASGRPSGVGIGQVSASAKAPAAAGYPPGRSAAETPGSPRRSARSLSPLQAEPHAAVASAPQRPQPIPSKWVSEDFGKEQVIRTLDLSSETSQISPSASSPLSPLNARWQVSSMTTQAIHDEYVDLAPALLQPNGDDELPQMRSYLYHNYPTTGLYM